MKPEIAHFFDERVYDGGLTYNGHPISLAAAIANIEVLQQDHLIENSRNLGTKLHHLLIDLAEKHPSIGETRNIGLFGIMELVRDRKTREPMAPFQGSSKEMTDFRSKLLESGLFAYTHWHTLLIIPPLCITEAELDDGLMKIDSALSITDAAVKSM